MVVDCINWLLIWCYLACFGGMMIFAGIVAGGVGKRFGGSIPKQFLNLGNRPILVHTIEKFLICKNIDAICVGVCKDWLTYSEKIVSKFIPDRKKVILCLGGKTRNDTIVKIVESLEEKFGLSGEHLLLTHDAVRPFVSSRVIYENIRVGKKFHACGTAICSKDTIFRANVTKDEILEIPRRKFMFLAQTPQTFNMNKLKGLLNSLTEDQKHNLTDTCGIFVTNNEKVKIVQGDLLNFKITTKSDYLIAQSIIAS